MRAVVSKGSLKVGWFFDLKLLTPSSSSDLNFVYYWAWSDTEARNKRVAHTTKTYLIATIMENFASLDWDIMVGQGLRAAQGVG